MNELKPCPFCGGEAKVIKDGTLTDQSVIYSALCTCCRTQCYWFETKEETIEAWNTRAERTCNMVPNGEHDYAAVLACSVCGNAESVYAISADDFNYCPNCGAKVVGYDDNES